MQFDLCTKPLCNYFIHFARCVGVLHKILCRFVLYSKGEKLVS